MNSFVRFSMCLIVAGGLAGAAVAVEPPHVVEISAEELEDRIRGGMLAQIIGNLNGLPHEFRYIDEPGQVEHYTPSLPEGAFTDDDTDVEWVYLREIARRGETRLTPDVIAALWRRHINRRIFCANQYARQLMDLGFQPPWTGNAALNPWSDFNISGQFLCESFGLMAPAMPQTAARIGLNYTRVAIDGEPAQTTQLFTTMIALAFIEHDVQKLLDAGLAAVDPACEVAGVVRETRELCAVHPADWVAARQAIKNRWQRHDGVMRDRNGYELNTACTVAALVYGGGDLVETLRIAFNLGWDCDNNAATAATIIGVIKGRRWIDQQGWNIADVYKNTTRDDMPLDETISGLEQLAIDGARLAIAEQGGERTETAGRPVYRIRVESAANVAPLATREQQTLAAREKFQPQLSRLFNGTPLERARAAYLALCFGEVKSYRAESPDKWSEAVNELRQLSGQLNVIFRAPGSAGNALRQQAKLAGLTSPP
jgi:hypothetical protein